ncbi:hypothetical protein NDU88_001248 [Pleurodeles waltl]|uniref:Uncharacterized protein n=1 Tax=Pleurodeles waltl TaxID=8319 RepID=A0AAV7KSY6_PLEWA|nr:hypothetical protein NDU88_001248 [Pleurodeles waltl]
MPVVRRLRKASSHVRESRPGPLLYLCQQEEPPIALPVSQALPRTPRTDSTLPQKVLAATKAEREFRLQMVQLKMEEKELAMEEKKLAMYAEQKKAERALARKKSPLRKELL